jgi:hypothetical protein
MNAKKVMTEVLAANARKAALASMGRVFKCTPLKAAERMTRPAAKYDAYRVAFINAMDEAITQIFALADNGHVAIVPAHWSAVDGTEARRAFVAVMASSAPVNGAPGSLVGYWMPNITSTPNTGAAA